MIEVEKKFHATPVQLEALLEQAKFMSEKHNTDIFFDRHDYSLSKKWSWLRERNGKMELKVAMHMPKNGQLCEYFSEFETDDEIHAQLALPSTHTSLQQDLSAAGYRPFAVLHTVRRSYHDGKFTIDVDHTTADEFNYDIVEIELMVEHESEMAAAADEIISFAQSKGLSIKQVNGKLLEYIERKNPEQFTVLLETGYRPTP